MVSSSWYDRLSVSFVGIVVPVLCRPLSMRRRQKRKQKNTSKRKRRGTAVPVRRDGLGIAVRHAVRLAAETSREGAQFRRRGALRPLQPACHQEENAILLDWPRGDHLHSEHRDTTVKWCKSCPSRRARDDGLSFNFPLSLSFSSFNSLCYYKLPGREVFDQTCILSIRKYSKALRSLLHLINIVNFTFPYILNKQNSIFFLFKLRKSHLRDSLQLKYI